VCYPSVVHTALVWTEMMKCSDQRNAGSFRPAGDILWASSPQAWRLPTDHRQLGRNPHDGLEENEAKMQPNRLSNCDFPKKYTQLASHGCIFETAGASNLECHYFVTIFVTANSLLPHFPLLTTLAPQNGDIFRPAHLRPGRSEFNCVDSARHRTRMRPSGWLSHIRYPSLFALLVAVLL